MLCHSQFDLSVIPSKQLIININDSIVLGDIEGFVFVIQAGGNYFGFDWKDCVFFQCKYMLIWWLTSDNPDGTEPHFLLEN